MLPCVTIAARAAAYKKSGEASASLFLPLLLAPCEPRIASSLQDGRSNLKILIETRVIEGTATPE